MNILVLTGGLSPERDVSFVSASMIAKALIRKKHNVCVMDLCENILNIESELKFTNSLAEIDNYIITENATNINKNAKQEIGNNVIECCKKADLVFLALHGDIGENGKLQALLELNNIKHTGSSYKGCMIAMDKNVSKLIAKQNGVDTADWNINCNDSIGYPCIVKPSNGGSSIGVTIVNNEKEFEDSMKLAKELDDTILVEELLKGREFSVGILDNKSLPAIEIKPKQGFYDYKNKYQPGLTVEECPANISPELENTLQETAIKMHKLLCLNYYSRIDFIVDENNKPFFLEANALPGMTSTSLLPQEANAAKIDYDTLCEKIALNQHI